MNECLKKCGVYKTMFGGNLGESKTEWGQRFETVMINSTNKHLLSYTAFSEKHFCSCISATVQSIFKLFDLEMSLPQYNMGAGTNQFRRGNSFHALVSSSTSQDARIFAASTCGRRSAECVSPAATHTADVASSTSAASTVQKNANYRAPSHACTSRSTPKQTSFLCQAVGMNECLKKCGVYKTMFGGNLGESKTEWGQRFETGMINSTNKHLLSYTAFSEKHFCSCISATVQSIFKLFDLEMSLPQYNMGAGTNQFRRGNSFHALVSSSTSQDARIFAASTCGRRSAECVSPAATHTADVASSTSAASTVQKNANYRAPSHACASRSVRKTPWRDPINGACGARQALQAVVTPLGPCGGTEKTDANKENMKRYW